MYYVLCMHLAVVCCNRSRMPVGRWEPTDTSNCQLLSMHVLWAVPSHPILVWPSFRSATCRPPTTTAASEHWGKSTRQQGGRKLVAERIWWKSKQYSGTGITTFAAGSSIMSKDRQKWVTEGAMEHQQLPLLQRCLKSRTSTVNSEEQKQPI